MPTTVLKNLMYRCALPFQAPRLDAGPDGLAVTGGRLYTQPAYFRLLKRHHVLGSAALLRDGSNRVTLLCSSRNPAHPVREDSLFRVASITKMAASLAALIAVEQGKLSLSAPVSGYFPDPGAVPQLDRITLTHLLSHTSGLKDPDNLEDALLRKVPFSELLPDSAASVPGTEFRYSNLGFGLVGCLLEAVYGQPISRILEDLVFRPLGMNADLDASRLDPERIVPISRILPWRPGRDLRITPLGAVPLTEPDPLRHYGHTAGSMYLDLASLEKLVQCLMKDGAPLLKTGLGKHMTQEHAVYGPISPTLSYGLGILRIRDSSLSDHLILGHQGFAYGCADGAFWEEGTGRMVLFLNGGASEARKGRLGLCNYEVLRWALKTEMPRWRDPAAPGTPEK